MMRVGIAGDHGGFALKELVAAALRGEGHDVLDFGSHQFNLGITARMGRDPGEIYHDLTHEFGEPVYDRVEAPASPEQKKLLAKLSPQQVKLTELAGEKIQNVLTHAPGNDAPIGGLKVIAASGWFAARPSGTESIYKIYAESFRGAEHLRRILEEAQTIVSDALAAGTRQVRSPNKSRVKETV